ncbi:MAG: OmpA family protein [Saccharospirillum sp.]|nr:OmpA family protein [Saccharospirillum sp.]
MRSSITTAKKIGALVTTVVFTLLVVASCAMSPESPDGAAEVRSRLAALQSNSDLAERARVEIREAEEAVRIAEQPLSDQDSALAEHRVLMAETKVSIAEAKAMTRFAEHERSRMGEERDELRLQARTLEADRARAETADARSTADAAVRSQEAGAAMAAEQLAEFQRQIEALALEAETTDRGIVLTLGDVLFATGSADLQPGARSNLDRLATFLNQYPDRNAIIEGHTDNVGSESLNQQLSQRRADSVRNYLVQRGIESRRLSATGLSMSQPVASNDTASGRQQNRRIEIIIDNPQ